MYYIIHIIYIHTFSTLIVSLGYILPYIWNRISTESIYLEPKPKSEE